MEHKQGTKIIYKVGDLEGHGIIVGVAFNGQFAIGITYIIQDNNIMNEKYPYTHFVLNELQFIVED